MRTIALIMRATAGALADVLFGKGRGAILALIYGSMARREEKAESDIDLMIVGKVTPEDVLARTGDVEPLLGRAVNPTVYSEAEFKTKLASGNHFLNSVLRGEKVFLIGEKDELGKVGGIRLAES